MPLPPAPRLALAPLTASDWPLYRAIYTDAGVLAHAGGALDETQARRGFELALQRHRALAGQPAFWVVREAGPLARELGLAGLLRRQGAAAELGLLLLPTAQRQGHGSEIVSKLVALAFADKRVDHVAARHHPGNLAMARLLARAGFRPGAGSPSEAAWFLPRSPIG